MKLGDQVTGSLTLLLGGGVVLSALGFPAIPGQPYGPATFPVVLGLALVASGGCLVRRGLAPGRGHQAIQAAPWMRSRDHIVRAALVPGALLFYVMASNLLGFVASATVILTVLMVALGRRFRSSLLVAIVTAIAIRIVFGTLLRVPLPAGLFETVFP